MMLATVAVAEFVAPPLDQYARIRRSQAIYGKSIMLTKSGFWTRHGRSIIYVGKTIADGFAADLDIYEQDEQGRLHRFFHAREATIVKDNQWLLKDIEQKNFSEQGMSAQHRPSQTLDAFLSTEQLSILELPPDSLSLSDLYQYMRGLQQRGQNAERYVLSFWQKVTLPLTNVAMMLLALTFIFGHRREITTGRRIVLASMVGIFLYLANQILGHLGLLLNLHPASITLLPVLVIFGISIWLLRRIR
jgi:lipopolysaccharide export system permease protein